MRVRALSAIFGFPELPGRGLAALRARGVGEQFAGPPRQRFGRAVVATQPADQSPAMCDLAPGAVDHRLHHRLDAPSLGRCAGRACRAPASRAAPTARAPWSASSAMMSRASKLAGRLVVRLSRVSSGTINCCRCWVDAALDQAQHTAHEPLAAFDGHGLFPLRHALARARALPLCDGIAIKARGLRGHVDLA
ncbi:MAG: hypothetical protein H7337_11425 [Rhizobacter sp.]|nr:hypothetical protein [Rhizobacter sp.]